MIRLFKNETIKLETTVTDSNGDFVSGLTVTYEIRSCVDDSLVASGTMSEVNSVYTTSYVFSVLGEFRIKYFTPSTYENGFDNIVVEEDSLTKTDGVETSLTMKQTLRALLAVMAGKATGGGTTTITFVDPSGAIDRVIMTVDANGNRSAVTLDT